MAEPRIAQRKVEGLDPVAWADYHPLIARMMVARGVKTPDEIPVRLGQLIPPRLLGDIFNAAQIIGDAIMQRQFIMIAGDYDCDGATGTATAMRGLRMMGCERADFSIPNRFRHGYGVSPELVADMSPTPDLIVTVDSGVASVAGVAAAKERGIRVVITDHHLPGDILPDADAIVNPNLRGDPFPSKALAGVGVMFYVLMATNDYLTREGWYTNGREPARLQDLLDLVAIGTVADLVPLDFNNRLLVAAGLARIRNGHTTPGVKALIANSRCSQERLTSTDIAFNIGPRINAAGRLADMRVGVMAMIEPDVTIATHFANTLEEINNERKEKTGEMVLDAEKALESLPCEGRGIVIFNGHWHSGIVGLVASRVKEAMYRPVIALAPAEPGSTELRGSARSIPGFHLRDALALVDARNPGLMKKFGGHAMAAGLSLDISKVDQFKDAFASVADELITDEMLVAETLTDGSLPHDGFTLDMLDMINRYGPWGQGFPAPMFSGRFYVLDTRVLKEKHLKLRLATPGGYAEIDAIQFNAPQLDISIDQSVELVFELNDNEFRGNRTLQLMVRHLRVVDDV